MTNKSLQSLRGWKILLHTLFVPSVNVSSMLSPISDASTNQSQLLLFYLLLSSRQRCPPHLKSHHQACLLSFHLRWPLLCRLPWRSPWPWTPRPIWPNFLTSGKKRGGAPQISWCPSWQSKTLSLCLSVFFLKMFVDVSSVFSFSLQDVWADWTGDCRISQSRSRSIWWPSPRWPLVHTSQHFCRLLFLLKPQ